MCSTALPCFGVSLWRCRHLLLSSMFTHTHPSSPWFPLPSSCHSNPLAGALLGARPQRRRRPASLKPGAAGHHPDPPKPHHHCSCGGSSREQECVGARPDVDQCGLLRGLHAPRVSSGSVFVQIGPSSAARLELSRTWCIISSSPIESRPLPRTCL